MNWTNTFLSGKMIELNKCWSLWIDELNKHCSLLEDDCTEQMLVSLENDWTEQTLLSRGRWLNWTTTDVSGKVMEWCKLNWTKLLSLNRTQELNKTAFFDWTSGTEQNCFLYKTQELNKTAFFDWTSGTEQTAFLDWNSGTEQTTFLN